MIYGTQRENRERREKSTSTSKAIDDKPGPHFYFIFILFFAFRGNAVPTGWEYHVSLDA